MEIYSRKNIMKLKELNMVNLSPGIQITEWLNPEDKMLISTLKQINKDFPGAARIERDLISKYYNKIWDTKVQCAVFVEHTYYKQCLNYVLEKCRIKTQTYPNVKT